MDYKESWALKNWCFWTVVLKKTPESPLDCKEIKPVNLKENQSWVFIRKADAEAKAPTVSPPDTKSQLIGKDPDAGKDWRKEQKGTTEDKKVGWHHWLNGQEFEQALGDGKRQGSLECCSPRGHKESDVTGQLNNNTTKIFRIIYPFTQQFTSSNLERRSYMSHKKPIKKSTCCDFSGGPVLRICLPMQRTCVQSLVRDLRSHMPWGN